VVQFKHRFTPDVIVNGPATEQPQEKSWHAAEVTATGPADFVVENHHNCRQRFPVGLVTLCRCAISI
jgi:hypothetical protein